MTKLRVIVGQGTASEVYQYTGAQGEYETLVIPQGPLGCVARNPRHGSAAASSGAARSASA